MGVDLVGFLPDVMIINIPHLSGGESRLDGGEMSDTISINTDGTWVTLDVVEPRIRLSHIKAFQLAEELRQCAEKVKSSLENCSWCGGKNTEESQCNDCGAFSIEYGNIEPATFEELLCGWFKGGVE